MSEKIYTSKDVSMVETEFIRLGRDYDKLKAELEQVKGERDAMREALKIRLQKIVSDDRINYPPANVMINAPLALIQVNLDTEKEVLEWAISLMDAAALKDAK